MKQNKLKMSKLTDAEKKALAKQCRREMIADIILAVLAVIGFAIIIAIARSVA